MRAQPVGRVRGRRHLRARIGSTQPRPLPRLLVYVPQFLDCAALPSDESPAPTPRRSKVYKFFDSYPQHERRLADARAAKAPQPLDANGCVTDGHAGAQTRHPDARPTSPRRTCATRRTPATCTAWRHSRLCGTARASTAGAASRDTCSPAAAERRSNSRIRATDWSSCTHSRSGAARCSRSSHAARRRMRAARTDTSPFGTSTRRQSKTAGDPNGRSERGDSVALATALGSLRHIGGRTRSGKNSFWSLE
jgi:hypothetical protein